MENDIYSRLAAMALSELKDSKNWKQDLAHFIDFLKKGNPFLNEEFLRNMIDLQHSVALFNKYLE